MRGKVTITIEANIIDLRCDECGNVRSVEVSCGDIKVGENQNLQLEVIISEVES